MARRPSPICRSRTHLGVGNPSRRRAASRPRFGAQTHPYFGPQTQRRTQLRFAAPKHPRIGAAPRRSALGAPMHPRTDACPRRAPATTRFAVANPLRFSVRMHHPRCAATTQQRFAAPKHPRIGASASRPRTASVLGCTPAPTRVRTRAPATFASQLPRNCASVLGRIGALAHRGTRAPPPRSSHTAALRRTDASPHRRAHLPRSYRATALRCSDASAHRPTAVPTHPGISTSPFPREHASAHRRIRASTCGCTRTPLQPHPWTTAADCRAPGADPDPARLERRVADRGWEGTQPHSARSPLTRVSASRHPDPASAPRCFRTSNHGCNRSRNCASPLPRIPAQAHPRTGASPRTSASHLPPNCASMHGCILAPTRVRTGALASSATPRINCASPHRCIPAPTRVRTAIPPPLRRHHAAALRRSDASALRSYHAPSLRRADASTQRRAPPAPAQPLVRNYHATALRRWDASAHRPTAAPTHPRMSTSPFPREHASTRRRIRASTCGCTRTPLHPHTCRRAPVLNPDPPLARAPLCNSGEGTRPHNGYEGDSRRARSGRGGLIRRSSRARAPSRRVRS